MNEALEKLIQALREELQQSGEMLARLEEQQGCASPQSYEDLLQATAAIETQSQTMQRARRLRIESLEEVACSLNLPGEATVGEIILKLPADYRPLLTALVHENNESLGRIHHRSRQNHSLLSRSLEMMSRLQGAVRTGSATPVHTDKLDVSSTFAGQAIKQAAV
jgi:hypothetical protein